METNNDPTPKDNVGKQPQNQDWSAYKRMQVQCKHTSSPEEIANLPHLVDVCNNQIGNDGGLIRLQNPVSNTSNNNNNIKLNYYQGPMYGLKEFPGFVYCPNAIASCLQLELAFQAVTEYCEDPHATNIDLVPPKEHVEIVNRGNDESMWALWKRDHGFVKQQHSNVNNNNNNNTEPCAKKTKNQSKKKYYKSFQKLSWATTGYQYDWTARSYHEGAKSPMPEALCRISTLFARTALALELLKSSSRQQATINGNMNADTKESSQQSFTPSASIVNYYRHNSVMGGHKDDLEYALDKPVVSISMGLPAIFLLGGNTKDDTPVVPIVVRPGDVMMLGGDARLNIHGMARVLYGEFLVGVRDAHNSSTNNNNTVQSMHPVANPAEQLTIQFLKKDDYAGSNNQVILGTNGMDEVEQQALLSFLTVHRININVRQVHKD